VQDRTCELIIPNDWKPISDPTGRCVVSVGDLVRDQFLSVSFVNRSDFDGSLTDFLNQAASEISARVQNCSETQPISREIGGMPAQEVRIAGSENRFKFIYTVTIVESKSRYYRILTFTRPSSEREASEVFAKVQATFKPIEQDS
jgi:hypothetical protein